MQQRLVIEVVAALSGLLLAGLNLAATWRIWKSRELERPQQIAQTILLWLLPGTFLAVRYELHPPPEPKNDPTVPKVSDDSTHALGGHH